MTDAQKLTTIKTLLSDGGDLPSDDKLQTYLTLAASEILAWIYHHWFYDQLPDHPPVCDYAGC